MLRHSFACFILCHGRPNNVPTYDTLLKLNYTGDIYIVCDDEDDTLSEYIERFGEDKVLVFNKKEQLELFDTMDTSSNRSCAVYARNACYSLAKKLGLEYFCQLDDDYSSIDIRKPFDETLPVLKIPTLDTIFNLYCDYIEDCRSKGISLTLAFAQPGDYIGGYGCQLIHKGYKRKCMNSWICTTDKILQFNGRMNDDVNTYTLLGSRGDSVFLTLPWVQIVQPETQAVKGGMTEMYSGEGTYSKSFYTVMCCPSFVKVYVVGRKNFRIHHSINWENAVPKIISSRYKKH